MFARSLSKEWSQKWDLLSFVFEQFPHSRLPLFHSEFKNQFKITEQKCMKITENVRFRRIRGSHFSTRKPASESVTDDGEVPTPTGGTSATISSISENAYISLIRALQEQFSSEFANINH